VSCWALTVFLYLQGFCFNSGKLFVLCFFNHFPNFCSLILSSS
jgi:hypothetical protein